MLQRISLLGSTGSIGRQSLEVIAACGFQVTALAMNKNIKLAEEQCRKFKPEMLSVSDDEAYRELKIRLADTGIKLVGGSDGLIEAAVNPHADTVVTAVMGMVGLKPTLAAIHEKKRIALANKETLVCAGELVMSTAKECGAEIVPVDSEHSAIFQCLQCNKTRGELKRIILTASGGPFFGKSREELKDVTKAQALKHPNWSMGAKITIDSASLMNKGLEFIEAMRLYDVSPDQIQIVVHRESIIHSMVEFVDNAIIAQLGTADMRLPIQLALTWPERTQGVAKELDFFHCPPLTFAEPDMDTFRCLKLAIKAANQGGTICAAMNGANEAAVELFLNDKIKFLDIADLVEYAMESVETKQVYDLDDVLEADRAAREAVIRKVETI